MNPPAMSERIARAEESASRPCQRRHGGANTVFQFLSRVTPQPLTSNLRASLISADDSAFRPPPCASSGLPPPLPPNVATSALSVAPASIGADAPRATTTSAGDVRLKRASTAVVSAAAAAAASAFRPAASQPSSASTTTTRSARALAARRRARGLRARPAAPAAAQRALRCLLRRSAAARWSHASSGGVTDSCRVAAVRTSRQSRNARQRAAAAEELDASAAAKLLPAADRDDADRAGARDVRAAARRQVEVRDLDQPQRSTARRFLAQRQRGRLFRRRRTGS